MQIDGQDLDGPLPRPYVQRMIERQVNHRLVDTPRYEPQDEALYQTESRRCSIERHTLGFILKQIDP